MLMLRTKIPVTVWEEQGPTVVATALHLLTQEAQDREAEQLEANERAWKAVIGDGQD